MKYILTVLLSIAVFSLLNAQTFTEDEQELYNLIMELRAEYDLPEIPISVSLTIVAQTHAKDLVENSPVGGACNSHSWSDQGDWTACCFTSDYSQKRCMWDKPRELTSYKHTGYEVATRTTADSITPQKALDSWIGSQGHLNVLLNLKNWDEEWKAIGVGMYKNYAVVWFGRVTDEETYSDTEAEINIETDIETQDTIIILED